MLTALLLSCSPDPVSGETDGAGDSQAESPPAVEVPLEGCIWRRTALITVGGAELHVVVDSGSATLAVSALGCESCEDEGVRHFYDPTQGENLGVEVSGSYDDGGMGWSGSAYRDEVQVDGVPELSMGFVAVTDQTSIFGQFSCDYDSRLAADGILGLASDALLREGTDSYMSGIVSAGFVPDEFAFRICHEGGTLWLGGYDEGSASGEMSYAALSGTDFYTVEVTGLALSEQDGSLEIPVSNDGAAATAVLDSGGPNLIVPAVAYDALVAQLSTYPLIAAFGDPWWEREYVSSTVTPSELDAALPALLVAVGDDDVLLRLPATESYVAWWDNGDGSYTYWTSLLNGTAIGWGGYIDLGNLPMYSYVVHTDRANGRVGFAPAVACP